MWCEVGDQLYSFACGHPVSCRTCFTATQSLSQPPRRQGSKGAEVGTCSMILEEEVAESRLFKKYLAFDHGHTQSTKEFRLWDTNCIVSAYKNLKLDLIFNFSPKIGSSDRMGLSPSCSFRRGTCYLSPPVSPLTDLIPQLALTPARFSLS